MNFQVAGEIFPSFNSTEGIAIELYLSGCSRNPKCKGCHNELLWDFNYGKTLTLEDIINLLKFKYKDADSIAIMGGEPLNQPNIVTLLEAIKITFPSKPLWLYTSYELHEVNEQIFPFIDYIKTGRYDSSLATPSARLGSSNQLIYKKELLEELYKFEIFYEY